MTITCGKCGKELASVTSKCCGPMIDVDYQYKALTKLLEDHQRDVKTRLNALLKMYDHRAKK